MLKNLIIIPFSYSHDLQQLCSYNIFYHYGFSRSSLIHGTERNMTLFHGTERIDNVFWLYNIQPRWQRDIICCLAVSKAA